jgi:sortase (surface protein transpeptidase)
MRAWRLAILSPIVLAIVVIISGVTSQDRVGVSALSTPSPQANLVSQSNSTPSPLVRVMSRSVPTRIWIPSIGVDSSLMKLGLLQDGSLQVPPKGFPAGWYTGSPTPGELGPSIIAGHIDWKGPGVFYRLDRMQVGDKIMVDRSDGSTATFIVTRIASFPKNKFPTEAVYGNLNYPGLRLITCGGNFDFVSHEYVNDLVVFAQVI